MATNTKPVLPAAATHPGSILKRELKARGLKQKDFSKEIGMPAPNLSELINGKRNVTVAIAMKLEAALGIPYQNWMNLQNRYQYVKKCQEELAETAPITSVEGRHSSSHVNVAVM